MKNEDFENLINSMRTKLGEENSALIADDLGTLITDNSQMNNDLKNRDSQISKLKQDKENLITSNGNLLQQISMGDDISSRPSSKKEEKEEKEFSFKSCFDEKGNFIK